MFCVNSNVANCWNAMLPSLIGWHRFLLLLGNTVFSTSNYVDVIFAAWENFSYSYFGTVTLIPAETLHSFLELLFWHKISSHHLRVTIQGGDLTIYERTSLMNYMMNETIQVLVYYPWQTAG
ncbi:hypothetical protein OUZ56_002913 [Daphnia magna]|uniref:Uncharacterized protein n=1 Tax=Daphnia magna TaxID=35525 RepID=A0ABR0A7H1_9CRUS|nr:hypothetical protein OUZ56_002913 [Daphnia magna]